MQSFNYVQRKAGKIPGLDDCNVLIGSGRPRLGKLPFQSRAEFERPFLFDFGIRSSFRESNEKSETLVIVVP
jgi:hypothetical protein